MPTPETVTVMLIGGQSALSVYTALKRTAAVVVVTAGDALPALSVISCEAPLQLAA